MLPPEQLKGYVDIAVSLLGAGGLGAIVLAVIGIKKASPTPPVEDKPTIGQSGMMGLAGMMAGEHFGMQLLQHMQALTDSVKSLVRSHEDETRAMREASEDRRNSIRRLCEEIDSLTDATKNRSQGH